jgi:sterol desaturase/sphingolipid hydroxylase (fatty acid hydroxylase superfamily)
VTVRDSLGVLGEATLGQLFAAVCMVAVLALAVGDLACGAARSVRVRAEARTAAVMLAGSVVAGVLYAAAFAALFTVVSKLAPDPLSQFWAQHPIVAFAVAFVVWDATGWVYHYVGHNTSLGWASHRAHHTGSSYNATLALRQTWLPLPALAVFPLVAATGVGLPTVLVCAGVSNLIQAAQHTTAPWPTPRWFNALVVTAQAHRWHHVRGAGSVNLGPVFNVWDRLAGTWRSGPVPAGSVYGEGDAGDLSAVAAELDGWRRLMPNSVR